MIKRITSDIGVRPSPLSFFCIRCKAKARIRIRIRGLDSDTDSGKFDQAGIGGKE